MSKSHSKLMPQSKKSVLIIEDEKPLSQALVLKLSQIGFETTTALNGEIALEILEKQTFDVIILDLVMPKLDGFIVLKKMNQNSKVIVLTNLNQKEDEEKALSLGAKSFFIKTNTPIQQVVSEVEKLANSL